MKPCTCFSSLALLALVAIFAAGPACGQAAGGRAVIHIGGSFNQALADDAEMGFVGLDLFAGRMMNNNVCLGFFSGYDIVHRFSYKPYTSIKTGGPDFTETLAVVPATLKARYYLSITPMIQFYPQAAAGVYKTLARLGGNEVGGISKNMLRPGGSIGIGLDYWFLLTTGVGFEFDYHILTLPDGADPFSYWSLRVNYGIIKF